MSLFQVVGTPVKHNSKLDSIRVNSNKTLVSLKEKYNVFEETHKITIRMKTQEKPLHTILHPQDGTNRSFCPSLSLSVCLSSNCLKMEGLTEV